MYKYLPIALLLLARTALAADGNELNAVGAIQTGHAGAGVAHAEDATWALLNPAALVDLERRADFSFQLLYNDFTATPRGFPLIVNPEAGNLRDHNIFVIPAAGVVLPVGRGVFATGIYGMQGARTNYDRPRTFFGIFTNADRRIQFEVVKIPLSYGRRIGNGWALGASVVPAVARLRSDSVTPTLRPAHGDYHWDQTVGIGFKLGVYRRWERWSFGAAYTSRTWMDDLDLYERDQVRQNFDLPQKLQLGIAYRPAPAWEILLDYKWIDWSRPPGFGKVSTQGGVLWDDQHIYKLGVTWHATPRLTLRGGVSWGRPPIGNEGVIANALAPPLSEWHFATGLSYDLSARSTLHAALSYVPEEHAKDDGRGDAFSAFSAGTKAQYTEAAIIVQYSLRF